MRLAGVYVVESGLPAPQVVVAVARPTGGRSRRCPALLDTGADRTVLPAALVRRLGVGEERRLAFAGFDGRVEELSTHLVRLRVGDLPALYVEVAGGPGDECLLGRDVLNQYTLTLYGPAGSFTITDD